MKLLVRMPNWLGDAVMATPAIDNLLRHCDATQVVTVGPPGVCKLLAHDPRFPILVPDRTKSQRFRALGLWQLGRRLRAQYGPFDLALTLTNSLSSRLLLYASGASHRVGRRRGVGSSLLTHAIDCSGQAHEAETFNRIINGYLGIETETGPATLHGTQPRKFARPTVGINPGAAFGSARRWPTDRYGEVAVKLSSDFDIMIFGGPDELDIAGEVESHLQAAGRSNYHNVAGCSMDDMLAWIAGLDLFITNDTGPMHIAGALGIPIVAVFGPTDADRTRPWSHGGLRGLSHPVSCSPCKNRTCPLEYHACVLEIEPDRVVHAARSLMRWTDRDHSADAA
jgi:heptosyltransferase-2